MNLNEILTKKDLQEFENRLQNKIEAMLKDSSKQKIGEWLRNKDIKKMLGLSDGSVQNLRVNGTLPYTKLGGTYFYRYSDVIFILENNLKNI